MKSKGLFGASIFFVVLAVGFSIAYANYSPFHTTGSLAIGISAFLLALLASTAIRIAAPWDKAIVLRLGYFHSLRGPGVFFIVPILDTIPHWIDTCVLTTSFKAKKTLTKDTVPVDVDAVLVWKVLDPKKAALEVVDYKSAIAWASQNALQEVIAETMLSDMLDKLCVALQKIIEERAEPWGITIISVAFRNVLFPAVTPTE